MSPVYTASGSPNPFHTINGVYSQPNRVLAPVTGLGIAAVRKAAKGRIMMRSQGRRRMARIALD